MVKREKKGLLFPSLELPSSKLVDRFGFPPFSVLNTQLGEWKKRKNWWKGMGMDSELGRESHAYSEALEKWMIKIGYTKRGKVLSSGVSIFDPVLCELMYKWYTVVGDLIVDPFAGGVVRGFVASKLKRKYIGYDLSRSQIVADRKQIKNFRLDAKYVLGDSDKKSKDSPESDFIFTCPPYGDIEKYSDKPSDLSTMKWEQFCIKYSHILNGYAKKLKDNRFAVIVVANYRDTAIGGCLRNLVGETTRIMESSGLCYYDEYVLVNPVGSGCLRVTKQFNTSRKSLKQHQHVLVFVKGGVKKAVSRLNGG